MISRLLLASAWIIGLGAVAFLLHGQGVPWQAVAVTLGVAAALGLYTLAASRRGTGAVSRSAGGSALPSAMLAKSDIMTAVERPDDGTILFMDDAFRGLVAPDGPDGDAQAWDRRDVAALLAAAFPDAVAAMAEPGADAETAAPADGAGEEAENAAEVVHPVLALVGSNPGDGVLRRVEVPGPGPRAIAPWYEVAVTEDANGLRFWYLRDITKQHQRRERLRDRLALLSRALEQAPFGLTLLDGDFRMREANAAFRHLVGQETLSNRRFADLFGPAASPAIAEWLNAVGDAVSPPLDLDPAERTGTTLTVHAVKAGETRGGGGGILIHAVDATERRRLEQQFAQSQKMQALGQLAGGVAHDFNNMLTAIMGFSDLVLQRHHQGEQTFADVMQITQNAKRAARLVRQLLAFSRQQPLQPKLIDITDVLADITSLLRRVLGETVTLSLAHGRDLGVIRADQSQLEQIIINLAVNARDAIEGQGMLTIETGLAEIGPGTVIGGDEVAAGRYVTIRVADTGTGIPADILDKIFDPFFTTKEVGAGTGLGLSMVYGSMKQMGGYVAVDSVTDRAEGPTGTTFTLYIPQAAAQNAANAEDAAGGPAGDDVTGGGEILLVEDEDPVRMFSARALRSKGYIVTEARTGLAALDILEEKSFDLMVTDMMMPEMDGASLIQQARAANPALRIICISGYTEETAAKEVMELPHVWFLAKPFSLKQLAAKVKRALEAP